MQCSGCPICQREMESTSLNERSAMLSTELLNEAQDYMLREPDLGLNGWLVYDYRASNPIFWQVLRTLGMVRENIGMVTRPCFLFIPAVGEPSLLIHHVDAGKFRDTSINLLVYRNRRTMLEKLGNLLPPGGQVAMEYSHLGAIPRASKVDAGTVELVRSLGVEIVSSADLLQFATQRWSQAQLSSHMRSADKLGHIVLEAFEYIGKNLGRAANRVPGGPVHSGTV